MVTQLKRSGVNSSERPSEPSRGAKVAVSSVWTNFGRMAQPSPAQRSEASQHGPQVREQRADISTLRLSSAKLSEALRSFALRDSDAGRADRTGWTLVLIQSCSLSTWSATPLTVHLSVHMSRVRCCSDVHSEAIRRHEKINR